MPEHELHSHAMRQISPEADGLRLGCGWHPRDLDKPWIVVETPAGDSHPCASGLEELRSHVRDGILESGGSSAYYTCTDICDGIHQGTPAMDLSLASREVLAMAVEMHVRCGLFDGVVMMSGGDKSAPGHLLAAARLDIPTVFMTSGVTQAGPTEITVEQLGTIDAQLRRGEIALTDYNFLRENACPAVGPCAVMGTTNTGQVVSEAMGLTPPGAAFIPAASTMIGRMCRDVGVLMVRLVKENIPFSRIVTQKALENALTLHAATNGSTNFLLHFVAFAREMGLDFDFDLVQEINDRTPVILNTHPVGPYATDKAWYAGGVPRLMVELRDLLHLDAMTVTGQTVEEQLNALTAAGWFHNSARWLSNYRLKVRDIIKSADDPLQPEGAIAILRGNLAPDTAVIKRSAVAPQMWEFTGRARVFENQKAAYDAIYDGTIQPGDVVVIRYEGPRASGMPEQFKVTESIASHPVLNTSIALITDGRFSGCSRGPVIGHASPEAAAGGPLAVVENGDLIEINLHKRTLNMVGVGGERCAPAAIDEILAQRLRHWQPPTPKHTRGLVGLYTHLATSASQGGVMDWRNR